MRRLALAESRHTIPTRLHRQVYHSGYTRLSPNTRLAVRASTSVKIRTSPVSLLRNNREDALPLLGLSVSEPIVGDGTVPVAKVLARLESSANPTAGGLY
jgi:hypothetical protein